MKRSIRRAALLAATLSLGSLGGCLVAAMGAAGAGAAAGIYLSEQGASSLVDGSIVDVNRRALVVMRDLGIEADETTSAANGSRLVYRGHTRELDVVLELEESTPSTTQVHVTARRSPVEFDREYARRILRQIVER